MGRSPDNFRPLLHTCRVLVLLCCTFAASGGCSREVPPAPAKAPDREPREGGVESAKRLEPPFRGRLPRGAELYVPPWFAPRSGSYDLIVHFHGLASVQ